MTRKKEFHFDFNEDADPVDELHRLRVATSKHFRTMREYLDYLRDTPTAAECLAELDAEIAKRKTKATESRKRSTPKRRPASRHRKQEAEA